MQTNSNTTKHEEEENPLISLLNKNKKAFDGGSLMRVIRRDFELVKEVREKGIGWKEIVEALCFPGMEARARYSFFYEKRRRAKKEKEVVPEKKKEAMPDAKVKTQKESTLFRSEDKPKDGRIGPPKPIGRGRFELGKDIPDDEL